MAILDAINGFTEEISDLMDAMGDDYDVSGDDYRKICRIFEKMYFFGDMVSFYGGIMLLMDDMETDKDRFEVQKFSSKWEKYLEERLESLIKIGRTWKYEDYRCIDLMRRTTEYFVKAKAALNDESE